MTDEHKLRSLSEGLQRRDSGVLLIVAFLGLAMLLFALVIMMAR